MNYMANGFDIGSVTATVKADVTDFKKGMTDAQKSVSDFKGNLEGIGKGIQDFANKASIFTGVLTAGIALFGKESFDAYKGAQASQAQLEHAVMQVTKATEKELQATMDLADALERKGVLDGDNIKTGLAQLSTFGLSNKAVRALGGSLADLAVNQFGVSASGEQLSQTANMIAKALNGQFGVLEKSGIRFTDVQQAIIATGTEMEKVKAINEGFAQNLKYTNAVAGETAEGAMARLTVRLDNIKEGFGELVATGILPFANALADMAEDARIFDWIQEISDKLYFLLQMLRTGDFTKAFGQLFKVDEDSTLVTNILNLHRAMESFGVWITENQQLVIGFVQALAMTIGTLVVIGTVNALLMALLNPFTLVIMAITAFFFAYNTNMYGVRDITNNVVNAIIGFFNEYLMPFILMLVAFFQENWGTIAMVVTTTWEIIKAVVTVAIEVLTAIFGAFFALLTAWWKEHGDSVIAQVKAMWQIITGLFQVAGGVIMALVSVLTAFVTGDWNKAHDQLVKATMMAWNGIKNIFNGIIGFIANWGGQLVSNLVRPFQDAWNRIQDLVNKIKDALDFTKRHSPSVVDIVKKGVGLVNTALDGLTYNMSLNPTQVAQTVSNGGQSMSIASINISLDGAMIGSEYDANRIAERIGDGIIQKLKYSVRL